MGCCRQRGRVRYRSANATTPSTADGRAHRNGIDAHHDLLNSVRWQVEQGGGRNSTDYLTRARPPDTVDPQGARRPTPSLAEPEREMIIDRVRDLTAKAAIEASIDEITIEDDHVIPIVKLPTGAGPRQPRINGGRFARRRERWAVGHATRTGTCCWQATRCRCDRSASN